jgi:hypothetical protein
MPLRLGGFCGSFRVMNQARQRGHQTYDHRIKQAIAFTGNPLSDVLSVWPWLLLLSGREIPINNISGKNRESQTPICFQPGGPATP